MVVNGGEQIISALIEQRFVGQSAWGKHAHHRALYRSFAGLWVTNLLADGHRQALLNQFSYIALGGMIGHAAHWNGVAIGFAPGGQGNIQELTGPFGIIKK